MNLIDIYSLLSSEEITEEEAAQSFGLTTAQFKVRAGKWGHRLPLMLSVMDKIRSDQMTREEACATLGIKERAVNRLMESWSVRRPVKQYLVERTASKVKWEVRKKYAIDFIANGATLEEASEFASVNPRQMRRWVTALLDKHFKMPWKDLKTLTDHRRKRIASEIERLEGLELAKQSIISAIVRGDKTLQEEAMERVIARKAAKTNVRGPRAGSTPQTKR